jgi:hypothetical protein
MSVIGIPVGLNALPMSLHPHDLGFLYLGDNSYNPSFVHMNIIRHPKGVVKRCLYDFIESDGHLLFWQVENNVQIAISPPYCIVNCRYFPSCFAKKYYNTIDVVLLAD